MSVDLAFLWTFLSVFARVSAMLLSAPFFGTVVNVRIRVMLAAVISFALCPVVAPHIPAMPNDIVSLVLSLGADILVGLVIGAFLQLLVMAIQSAGSLMDTQVGIASAQIFNPTLGMSVTPLATLHFFLATVLVFITDSHHLLILAIADSYSASAQLATNGPGLDHILEFVTQTGLLTLQIAMPVAAVTILIDISAALVNRAVPQTQPFLLALPAKLSLGILVLGIGLPALTGAVAQGVDMAFTQSRAALGF